MLGLSNLIMELGSLGMFRSIESVNYRAISKDHIGEIRAVFNGQEIQVPVYTGDDAEKVAKKIIEKADF